MVKTYKALQEKLLLPFIDLELLDHALTHRSAAKYHNERLEFLGDSLLGFFVAEYLYAKFPQATEGELSRMRASLVNKTSLATLAREIDIGHSLQLGSGERSSGGAGRDSILSNTIEAIIAAIYLDRGLDACREQVVCWTENLLTLVETVSHKDSKTRLQELMQSNSQPLPVYEVVEMAGEAHNQIFTVACSVKASLESKTGSGRSKRLAEQEAAKKMLEELENKQ